VADAAPIWVVGTVSVWFSTEGATAAVVFSGVVSGVGVTEAHVVAWCGGTQADVASTLEIDTMASILTAFRRPDAERRQ